MAGILKTFIYAWKGLRYAFQTQRNIWIHSVISILTLFAGFFFQINLVEWCLVFLSMGLVLSLECMNTSIEELTNLVSPQNHTIAGRVKDLAAGSVLLASFFALLVGIFIFLPKALNLLGFLGYAR